MIPNWIDEVQKNLMQSLIEQLYKLEEENKQLKNKSSGSGSSGGGEVSQDALLRKVKLEVLGDPRLIDEMEL